MGLSLAARRQEQGEDSLVGDAVAVLLLELPLPLLRCVLAALPPLPPLLEDAAPPIGLPPPLIGLEPSEGEEEPDPDEEEEMDEGEEDKG